MNKICVVARNFETYFLQRLISEVGQERVLLSDPRRLQELPLANCYVIRTTGAYRDDRDLTLLEKLSPGSVIINPFPALRIFRDKATQYSWMEKELFPILPWVKLHETKNCFEELRCEEVVIKPIAGQGGWGVQRLKASSFQNWWRSQEERNDLGYLAQPYVEMNEYRVFFLSTGKRWVLRRIGEGLAANFARGGKAVKDHLPDKAENVVERLIEKSGALYGAIDLFVGQNSVAILELNTSPGIEQLEKVTREDIMLEFIKAFKIKS